MASTRCQEQRTSVTPQNTNSAKGRLLRGSDANLCYIASYDVDCYLFVNMHFPYTGGLQALGHMTIKPVVEVECTMKAVDYLNITAEKVRVYILKVELFRRTTLIVLRP